MKNLLVRLLLAFLFLAPVSALAQSSGTVVVDCTTGVGLAYSVGSNRPPTILPTGQMCVTGSFSVTFPTIGAAVPATGIYNAINVAGTLRGLSGLSTGSLFPAATAIVDASGNQITTFGGAATTSNASSGVATSSTNQANVVWLYGFNGTTWDQLQVDANKFLKIVLPAETTKVIGTVNQGTSPWVTSATQSGTWNITNVSGTVSLPTGAATSALQTTMNTTLGSPFQAGGAIGASENHVGEVGGNILPITNGMTTSNATVTTGQSIGGIQTLANAVRVSGSLGASGTSGIIQSVVLTFVDAVGSGPLDVYFYNATVTTGSNCQNATTFVLQTADRTNVLGVAHVTDFTASNTAAVAQANNLAIPFGLASSTSLFACVVARGSFAITGTSNASLKVNVLRN